MTNKGQDEQEDFLARWSRRKALSRKGEELPEPAEHDDDEAQESAAEARTATDPAEGLPAEPAADDTDMPAPEIELPPLDSLDADSDYSAFMGSGVPSELKQKALRKLFQSPKFNVRDGLDDYDWDFSNPEPLGKIITAEMRHRIERELERLAGLDDGEQNPEDAPSIAAVESSEQVAANDEADPEADDERSEPS